MLLVIGSLEHRKAVKALVDELYHEFHDFGVARRDSTCWVAKLSDFYREHPTDAAFERENWEIWNDMLGGELEDCYDDEPGCIQLAGIPAVRFVPDRCSRCLTRRKHHLELEDLRWKCLWGPGEFEL